MKINQILIFISTAVVLYSMSSSETVDAWVISGHLCWKDGDCHSSEVCRHFKCTNPCRDVKCDEENTGCQIVNRKAICECAPKHSRNEKTKKCEKEECTEDRDCGGDPRCLTIDRIRTCVCLYTSQLKRANGYCGAKCAPAYAASVCVPNGICSTDDNHCDCPVNTTFDPENGGKCV